MTARHRVLIVDDHVVTRQGVRVLLEMTGRAHVVGEAGTGLDAIGLCDELRPDVVFLDLQMPEMSGLDALHKIKANHPEAHVVILTVEEGGSTVIDAVRAGASGYLIKSARVEEYASALDSLEAEGLFMSPAVTAAVMQTAADGTTGNGSHGAGHRDLTEREQEVLELLGEGLTARAIARRLGISERTVNTHIGNLYRRMGVNNRVDAIRTAMRNGLLAVPH